MLGQEKTAFSDELCVDARNLCKTYVVRERQGLFKPSLRREIHALRGINVSVAKGEFVALLGRNGAGKTTFLKIVSTLLLPTAGEVQVLGFDPVRQPKEVRRKIGVVLSGERTLYWKLTGMENLLLFAGLYNIPRRKSKACANELLELVGLSEFARIAVEKYSTGMRKRLALARALIHNPALLILDEPTSGLDPQATAEMWETFRRFRMEQGITILMATHNMLEAELLPERLLIIEEGLVVAEGSPAAIKEQAGGHPTVVLQIPALLPEPSLSGARLLRMDEKWLCVVPLTSLSQALTQIHTTGLRVENLQIKESTLWDAFLKLTGRPFDDISVEAEEEE